MVYDIVLLSSYLVLKCISFNMFGILFISLHLSIYTIPTLIDEIQISPPPCFLTELKLLSFRSREWKPESEGNCYGEKDPIYNEGYWGSGSDLPTMSTVEKILSNLSSKVSVINITQLSEYRKDGHPSIFRKFWEPLRPEQLSNPSSYSDCIHWCLPGVPDVWNELLFHFL